MMASNHKLTGVLKGRSINSTTEQGHALKIDFSDGSVMTVKVAGSTNSAVTGGVVRAVRQQDTSLHLDMEDGSTWTLQTAEATSCVMVRAKDHTLEYAD